MLTTKLFEKSMSSYFQCGVKLTAILLFSFTLLNVTACGGKKDSKKVTTEEVNTVTETTEEITANSKALKELKLQKEKWLENSINDYQFEMQKLCFCTPDAVRLMVFEIKDNKIDSVRYADSNEEVDVNLYNEYNTIDGLFTLAEEALANNPAEIHIVYDDKYGYIREYTVDLKENIADDEVTIMASNMRQKK